MKTKRIPQHTWLVLLLLPLLAVASAVSNASQPQPTDPGPPPPPAWPTNWLNAPPDIDINVANRLYLPVVTLPDEQTTTNPRQEAARLYRDEYLASATNDPNWTGNQNSCQPGTTSTYFKERVLQRLNYFRKMAGIPAVQEFEAAYNRQAQAAALMMSANRDLDHFPAQDWDCYTQDGANGAGSSNLYLGRYGADAVSGYIKDPGGFNTAVGHRRWLLFPYAQTMGTGDIPASNGYPAANAFWVFGQTSATRPATDHDFVSWPPPGYVPYQVVYPRWSLSYPEADFTSANVTLLENGQPVDLTIEHRWDGSFGSYGESTIVFRPSDMSDGASWSRPSADMSYSVTIDNVLVNGQPRTFTYEVIVFDPDA